MTYAHMGSLVAQPGKRDAVVEILTRLRPELRDAGCLLYEVGTKDGEPDTVYAIGIHGNPPKRTEALLQHRQRESCHRRGRADAHRAI